MRRFSSPKTYALISGMILFVIGVYGFAFRGQTPLPDGFLVLDILLGFWGILVGMKAVR
jgi:hypothetical protein